MTAEEHCSPTQLTTKLTVSGQSFAKEIAILQCDMNNPEVLSSIHRYIDNWIFAMVPINGTKIEPNDFQKDRRG